MENVIGLVIGVILGSALTFISGVVVYILVQASKETSQFTLFQEIASRLETEKKEPTKPNPKPKKAKNGRRKPADKRRNPTDGE